MPNVCGRLGGRDLCAGANTTKCSKITGEEGRRCDGGVTGAGWMMTSVEQSRRIGRADASLLPPPSPPIVPPAASDDVLLLSTFTTPTLGPGRPRLSRPALSSSALRLLPRVLVFPLQTLQSRPCSPYPLPGDHPHSGSRSEGEHQHHPWVTVSLPKTARRSCALRR